jgi:photosystem II stability/assembly factor-like uncharacterized protein
MSTDMVHWRDVTPAGSGWSRLGGDHPFFESASFIDAATGWVTSWDPGTIAVRIWRTSNGGRSWSSVSGGAHNASAGSTTWVQLLSRRFAVRETVEPNGPNMSLATSHESGRRWQVVYNGPQAAEGQAAPGPFGMPIEFVTQHIAIATPGDPPAEASAPGPGGSLVFRSVDGGRTWSAQHPAGTGPRCAQPDMPLAATRCAAALPSRYGHSLLLPVVRQTRTSAVVTFDVSRNSGGTWSRTTSLHVPTGRDSTYPLVSFASRRTWWVVSTAGGTVRSSTTVDGGRHWRAAEDELRGRVRAFFAVSASQAWMQVDVTVADGMARELFVTHDGGRTWHRWTPPSR